MIFGRVRARVGAATFAMLAAGLVAGCAPAPDHAWHQESGYRWRALNVKGGADGFTSMDAATTGIRFQNSVSDSALLGNRVLAQGAGVALGDVDGDGLPDIFLARTEGCSALYRNLGNWRFEEITKTAGVGACDRHSTGAVLADVDGDGDLDLILLSTTGPNAIFMNDGHAHFTERRDLGLDTTGRGGTTATLADVDGSGRLAMYVANYKAYNIDDSLPPQLRAFNQVVRQLGPKQFEVVPERRRDYRLVMRPDMGGLRMTQRAAPDEFYTSDGAGHFTRVALTSGRFRDARGKRLASEPESFTLGARFADLNGDGAPDLYVANDFEDTDELWLNDGHGNFRLADWTAQRQMSNSTMGTDIADVNGDGLPDLFCVDMLANDSHRLKTQIPTSTGFPKRPGEMQLQLQQQRNTLFLNRGDGTFAEVAQYAGVSASGWSWGTMFLDVDLDGWQDILIANGHSWDVMDADVQEGLQNRLNDVPWQRLRWQFPPLKLKNVAYRNRGDLTFEDVSQKWHFGTEDDQSHALAAADLDGDGDLDVVVNRLGAPALVLRNDASAPRVAVRLAGKAPNTKAVGARIRLLGGATPLQQREVSAGGLYMSHSDYLASFGMGKSTSASLEVRWRNGATTVIKDVRPNREYEITESGVAPSVADGVAVPDSAQRAGTLFEDATAQLGGHVHTEPVVDEWDRQFLLPSALSPLGPAVAWIDLDRDGADDLVIGTGRGGRVAVFMNRGGRLVPQPRTGPGEPASIAGIVGLTENGTTRLIAGVSTWQARSDSEMLRQPSVVSYESRRGVLSASGTPLLGSHAAATGPIALGDYDGDGALDLFVGSRAVPMHYPRPASSGLFRNVGGHFVLDSVNSALLRDVGMVSAAVFADVNGDGHADLLLARDWGSIVLLLNDGHGRFHRAPPSWGLDKLSSRWNGIATGDLDGDGRLDFIATSWGRNTELQADSARPLVLAYGPFGAAHEEEMLLARHDPRVKGLSPLASYARVRVAMPDLVGRLNSFSAYADATLEQVLGPHLAETSRLAATTFDHIAFLNRGDHFIAVPLPREAQLAPAFAVNIADFDGDGREDVFIGQNFSQTAVGLARDDAGRGLLLLGDGKGGLTPQGAQRSGIAVYGDQRGAAYADYDGDGRLDLVVSQNGAATRLFRNRGAKPGLRVRVVGPAGNPDGIGTQLRIVYAQGMGPVREVQSASGYWSGNSTVQLFGLSATPVAVRVRWPGGVETSVPVPVGAREVTVRR